MPPCHSRAGWYTNIKGMMKATMASLTETKPVRMGSDSAMEAPAKAVTHTGGVITERMA